MAPTLPSAQCHCLHRSPRLLFPNHWWRRILGDLMLLLSKNNGRAFTVTGEKGWEGDAGERDLTEKESPQGHALAPPKPSGTGRGYLHGHMSQRT